MNQLAEQTIRDHFHRSRAALDRAASEPAMLRTIYDISTAIERAIRAGNKLLIAGNGGSAADAQHIAGEFVSRFAFDRAPLPAIALTTDTSALTAIGNDYGFEHIFERQLRGLGSPGDIFLAISTSGQSPNVLLALRTAHAMKLTTVGFTGIGGGRMRPLVDICLCAPSDETPIIQQLHIVAFHAVCSLVESTLFSSQSTFIHGTSSSR